MNLAVIEGPYLADLLAQPDALARARERLARAPRPSWRARDFRMAVLTGMGASYHALLPLQQALLAAGAPAVALETSELLLLRPGLLREDVLLVVASQSGGGAEALRLMNELPDGCPCIGVTNSPGSPLALRAGWVVEIHAGSETSVSCKTYINTLAALDWLGGALLGHPPGPWPAVWREAEAWMRGYLAAWREHVEDAAREADGAAFMTVCGRGASLASAGTGALILNEAARLPAAALSAAAFRHGPIEAAGPHALTVILEGGPAFRERHLRLAADIGRAGGRSLLISSASARPAFRTPAWPGYPGAAAGILPLQMMTLACAALRGFEPGRFRHASKVTAVE